MTHQEGLVELKVTGELPHELVDAVQPLEEDRAALVGVLGRLPTPVAKPVAVGQPLTLDQHLEALRANEE